MSLLNLTTFGIPINEVLLNAETFARVEALNQSPEPAYQGYTDVEEGQTTHNIGQDTWGPNTQITEMPTGATSLGTVTAIQNRGIYRDYDYDSATDSETVSTTHWWDENTGESITNEEANTRISALDLRNGVGGLTQIDGNNDGVVDGYSWTQNVERTFWNFLDRPSRTETPVVDTRRNFSPQLLPTQPTTQIPSTNLNSATSVSVTQEGRTFYESTTT